MADSVKIFKRKNLTFILTPKITKETTGWNVYIQTNLQTFYLTPVLSYWHNHVTFIGTLVQLGEVVDINSLAHYCGDRVTWAHTDKRFDKVGT